MYVDDILLVEKTENKINKPKQVQAELFNMKVRKIAHRSFSKAKLIPEEKLAKGTE